MHLPVHSHLDQENSHQCHETAAHHLMVFCISQEVISFTLVVSAVWESEAATWRCYPQEAAWTQPQDEIEGFLETKLRGDILIPRTQHICYTRGPYFVKLCSCIDFLALAKGLFKTTSVEKYSME